MKVLFLSLGEFDNLEEGSVHIDLMKRFAREHSVYLIYKRERKNGEPTELSIESGINVLRVRTGNIKNTNLIEKGISTILVEPQFKAAAKKYLSNIKFDLVLYTTPPITFERVVSYIKKRDKAVTYLLLKDIFPQNAVDLGMMSTKGPKGLIYSFFRKKEKKLYSVSDYLGCMSPANCEYIKKNNPELIGKPIEVCPNSIEVTALDLDQKDKSAMRKKYDIPQDKIVLVYGGNLGKPQGIDFLIECLNSQRDNPNVYILIVGNGTEFYKIENYLAINNIENVKLMSGLPRNDYERMINACDVGLIFLDYRFTIPNFPSRLLSYMQASLPIIACTDVNTDIGTIVEENGFGWKCESNNVSLFDSICRNLELETIRQMGKKSYKYLLNNYDINIAYNTIMAHFK